MSDYWHYVENDRWFDRYVAERERDTEHARDSELARRERLDEKGLPHFPRKRFRASGNQWIAIRDKIPPNALCVCCYALWNSARDELHHVLPRDGAGTWPTGDDVLGNLVPVCRTCHRAIEDRRPEHRAAVREALTDIHIEYLKSRIGDRWHVFLDRHYPERLAA